MSKAIAVVSGDIHYNLNTMHIADAAVRQAIGLANSLNVPFVSNGDMLDQKALLRAEYVNMIIETFKLCKIKPYVNVGNHSLINHLGKGHALNFLAPYAHIIDDWAYISEIGAFIIPYYSDVNELRSVLKEIPENSMLFLHQGLNGSDMGEYVQDPSALNPEDLRDFRSILSHYHNRQDIKCGRPRKNGVGMATYIGSPYTITFAEAKDAEKSIAIVYDDGTLEFVPTNLRKHVIVQGECESNSFKMSGSINLDDIVKVKVTGTKEELNKLNKQIVKEWMPDLNKVTDFKLELIPLPTRSEIESIKSPTVSLDEIIDNLSNVSDKQKTRLKQIWKNMK
jgi:acylphosphatase